MVASFTDAWIETGIGAKKRQEAAVASFTDAWIETAPLFITLTYNPSHLLQMRGLKQFKDQTNIFGQAVASFTDAWIETEQWYIHPLQSVASFTDAWIETSRSFGIFRHA